VAAIKPAAQSVHSEATLLLYFPLSQSTHWTYEIFAHFPASQFEQLLEASLEACFPASQFEQAAWPVEPWYLPCGHEVQFHAAVAAATFPTEQAVQLDDFTVGAEKPATQFAQELAPLELYFPRSQSVQ
jgi:hypothetical protein